MSNVLEVVEDKYKGLVQQVQELLPKFYPGHSEVQINHFILNDIEFPTDYSKYRQSQLELIKRYDEIVTMYYDIRKNEIELKRKLESEEKITDVYDKELAEMEIEQLKLQLDGKRNRLKVILYEMSVFYRIIEANKKFINISPEEELKYEREYWAAKAKNMPQVFEERYGAEYLKSAWGEDVYHQYLSLRKSNMGLLPREIMESIKQLTR